MSYHRALTFMEMLVGEYTVLATAGRASGIMEKRAEVGEMRFAVTLLLFCNAFCNVCNVATASPNNNRVAARMHFVEGTKLYDTGHFIEAAGEYERAFMLSDEPSLLFNMGQAFRLGGDHVRALRAYRSFLRRVPDSSNTSEVQAKIAELQKLVEQSEHAKQGPPRAQYPPPPPSTITSQTTPTVRAPAPAPLVVEAPAPPRAERRPIYKRAWFWGVIGGAAVAVALGVGLGVGLSQGTTTWPSGPSNTVGTVRW